MSLDKTKSIDAFKVAKLAIPGGVNSPARAFKSVGSDPVFIASANGATITDIDGNSYIDYVGSWGPMILGHGHPKVTEAIAKTATSGTSFGAPTLIETEMAVYIKSLVPSIDKVRMVNSGTEATMSALRLARGYTKRDLIIKFEGCYHGHGDSFLIKAGSGLLTLGTPDSPGVTAGTARDTLMAEYNNIDSVNNLFDANRDKIAGVILEPVTGNMGVVKPQPEFLSGLRKLCDKYGALLIVDEVMTGFRVSKGGAQELFNIKPDITTFGKIIGGGLPVGAYGGREEVMNMLAPDGPVYQAGTLSGNPLAMAAGLTTLKVINETPNFYEILETKAAALEEGIRKNIKELSFPATLVRVGAMMTLFFTNQKSINAFSDVMTCDTDLFGRYFNGMLNEGIYLAPSQFEAFFVSAAHTIEDIEKTIAANYNVLKSIQN